MIATLKLVEVITPTLPLGTLGTSFLVSSTPLSRNM